VTFPQFKTDILRVFHLLRESYTLPQPTILDLTTTITFLEYYEYRKSFLYNYLLPGLLPALCTNLVISLKVRRVLSARNVGLMSI